VLSNFPALSSPVVLGPDELDGSSVTDGGSATIVYLHQLLAGDGDKLVFVACRDFAGNQGEIVSGHIVLDTTPPATPTLQLSGLTRTRVTLAWTAGPDAAPGSSSV